MKANLTLNIFTVDCYIEPIECDSVRLCIAESKSGSFSGSYGIKRGHAKAVFSLEEGEITATKGEKVIFKAKSSGGFASIENDALNVTVDRIEENTAK